MRPPSAPGLPRVAFELFAAGEAQEIQGSEKRPTPKNPKVREQFNIMLNSKVVIGQNNPDQRGIKMCEKYPTQNKEEQMYEELMQEVSE